MMEQNINEKFENATFVVKVNSNENHTWQGNITWVEENRSINFRSVLELMKLMDSAVNKDIDISL